MTTEALPNNHESNPLPISKRTIVFLRHAVATHNVRDPLTGEGPNLMDPALADPHLTPQGQQMALHAGRTIGKKFQQLCGGSVNLILCSPLSRCLQTAILVQQQLATGGSQTPPIYAVEDLREAYGMHYPDKRRTKTELTRQFPTVSFQHIHEEMDVYWTRDYRENVDHLLLRVRNVLEWLANLPSDDHQPQSILVVSHGVWIEYCLNQYCPEVLGHGKRRVYNCDAFCGELSSLGTASSGGQPNTSNAAQLRNVFKLE